MTKFIRILGAFALAITALGMTAPTALAGGPAAEHIAYALQKHDFGRLANIQGKLVEYPRQDVSIAAPAAGTPADCAAFSGAWFGTLSNGRPLLLIVSSVGADCAATTYMSWGSEPGKTVDISGPWQKAGNGIYKRAGRNMPVGKHLSGTVKGGELELQATRKSAAEFEAKDGKVTVKWGSTKAELTPIDLGSVGFVPAAEPPGGLS